MKKYAFWVIACLLLTSKSYSQLWDIGETVKDHINSSKATASQTGMTGITYGKDIIGMVYIADHYPNKIEYYYFKRDSVIFSLRIEAKTEEMRKELSQMATSFKKEGKIVAGNGVASGEFTYYFLEPKDQGYNVMLVQSKK